MTFLFVNKKLIYRFLDEEEHQNLIKMAARAVLDKLADRIYVVYIRVLFLLALKPTLALSLNYLGEDGRVILISIDLSVSHEFLLLFFIEKIAIFVKKKKNKKLAKNIF